MCGIVGYVGKNKALRTIIEGLERLEYRGYDSSGIAYVRDNRVTIIKREGRINQLKKKIDFNVNSNVGIGHTRWATHGDANEINSHPHKVGKVTVVHNGIIENYSDIKLSLEKDGYIFKTQTDTEVAAALIDKLYKDGNITDTLNEFNHIVKGSYALGVLIDDELDTIYALKKESPLIIALGNEENYIASDVPTVLKYTNKYLLLDDEEYASINKDRINVYRNGKQIKKEVRMFKGISNESDKNGFDHYMEKEIYEQPEVIKRTISDYLTIEDLTKKMPDFKKYNRIDIVACGSAMHVGMIGKNLIEEYGNIPVTVDIASEYRYKKIFIDKKTLVIIISQSGETADSLAALKIAKQNGATTLGIINVIESTIARAADMVVYTKAGTEIAVATTKAYSSQLAILSLIAVAIGLQKNLIVKQEAEQFLKIFKMIPNKIEILLNNRDQYKKIAKKIYMSDNIMFIGRGNDYGLAMEGSLKLKEISYINAQGYAAGELKHGTISLIDKETPVISIVTEPYLAEKTISNIKEVKSRGAMVILLILDSLNITDKFYDEKIIIPTTNNLTQSLLTIIPLQLIAYEIAKLKQCDIDKPKNLAKSVTVE